LPAYFFILKSKHMKDRKEEKKQRSAATEELQSDSRHHVASTPGSTNDVDRNRSTAGGSRSTESGAGATKRNVTGSDYDGQVAE
jgi:hypothetical protein